MKRFLNFTNIPSLFLQTRGNYRYRININNMILNTAQRQDVGFAEVESAWSPLS